MISITPARAGHGNRTRYPAAVSNARVFVARLTGLSVFDPLGDEVGRVRDVVVTMTRRAAGNRTGTNPRVIGLVVEVPGRRRVFVPMTRVTSIDAGQVITTGLVNLRRFEQRSTETLVVGELFDREVSVPHRGAIVPAIVGDLAMEQSANRDWRLTQVYVRLVSGAGTRSPLRLRRPRGETLVVPIDAVGGLYTVRPGQAADTLIASLADLKPADRAEVIRDLPPNRRREVAVALDDETLADLLEELPSDDRVEIIGHLTPGRAADVLEHMQPDDATDLLNELPVESVEPLLQLMQPEEAAPIRRLLRYEEDTAGGLMTPEPVILGPEASIAEALATIRRRELSPAVASVVFVCRAPQETPTGRLLGLVHFQRLLREPPHQSIGTILDRNVEPLPAEVDLGHVSRAMAAYNMVAMPVTDEDGRLLGAVTIDDVLDHILPEDWREDRHSYHENERTGQTDALPTRAATVPTRDRVKVTDVD